MADPVTIGIEVALIAAQMAITASQKIKGPRLDDLSATLADYGTPIARFWGTRRLQPQIIHAEQLREKKVSSKTKGGKYENYKYYGTWAALICDHEIDDVSRIWMDKHLVYDRTKAGPISVASLFPSDGGVKIAAGQNYRLYKGTEDQLPDPRYEAWCEDRYGPDTAPAYRGSAYIFFEEIPLEKFGNRIPQLTVEAVNNKTNIYPVASMAQSSGANWLQFSPDYLRLYESVGGDEIRLIDVPTHTMLQQFSSLSGSSSIALASNYIYGISGFPSTDLIRTGYDGGDTVLATSPFFVDEVFYTGGLVCFRPYNGSSALTIYYNPTTTLIVGDSRSFTADHYFEDLANAIRPDLTDGGNCWAVGQVHGQNKVGFIQMAGDALATEHLVNTTADGPAYAMCNADGKFLTWQENKLFVVDPDTWTAGSVTTATVGGSDVEQAFRNVQPGSASIWLNTSEYDTSDGSLIRTVSPSNWGSYSGNFLYDPVNHALINQSVGFLNWLFLDRIGSNGVTLKTVVDDVSEWCGLTTQDSSALTQTVLGYSVTQGSGKDMIAPLLDIHDVDARPHDFGLQFLNRGSASSGTLLTEDFVRDGNSPRYTVTVQQDTDLPRRITFNFADTGKDQQTNTVISQRPLDATDSTREETIDLSTYVDTPDAAQQKADRLFRRLWNSRERPKNALTPQELGLEPGDVKTLNLDGVTRNVRLDKLTITPTSLECEWVRDEVTLAALNGRTGGTMDGRDPETIYIPGPTKGIVLDGPLVQDADNDVNPILYYAAGGYGTNWPGAAFYRGDDGTYDTLYAYVETTSEATWGITTTALATADANLWDRGNTVDVTVYGTLNTVTEADIDADTSLNLCALGADDRWEYIQFATATLTGTSGTANTYTLSDLKRGRRGTEINVGNHIAGDTFLLLSSALNTELGTDEVGNDMSFKAQSPGRDVDQAPAIDLTYDGNSLKPYAPARIIWTTDGTDMFGEIIRRSRIGGSWTGGTTIPLGENSEAYEVDIYHGPTFKRTISVSGTNLFTYTGAQIASDGNTVGVPPPLNAYQMSDTVGRGFALAA